MGKPPLSAEEMHPLFIVGVMFWFCKDKSLGLCFLSLWHMDTKTRSPLNTHTSWSATEAKLHSQRLSSLPLLRYTRLTLACRCWHSNLLSSLTAFLIKAMNKEKTVSSFPFSFLCHLLFSFYTFSQIFTAVFLLVSFFHLSQWTWLGFFVFPQRMWQFWTQQWFPAHTVDTSLSMETWYISSG